MDSIELELDAQFFDADVIARTAYRYSGDFYVSVRSAVPSHVVGFSRDTCKNAP